MNKRDHLKHMDRMKNALVYMMKNIQSKLKLEDVAGAENVNFKPVYFKDVFKEYFEMPWKTYYIKLKMREAARYIQYERSYLNLAKKFGYTDTRSFNKAFRSEIGMTPAEFLEKDPVVPDMPERKQLCGVPIQFELVKKDEFSICGVPLYSPNEDKSFDRLQDAAHALTCVPEWKTKLTGTSYIGIWSYDEEDIQYYLIGTVTDTDNSELAGLVRQDIGGGQYAVFSADKTDDDLKNAELSRMMARYALEEWRYINMKETNQLGFIYEIFDDKKLYLYVPLLGDFGNNKHWRASMEASLYREYIDSHIMEQIKISEYVEKAHYTERWLRDSFKCLYGITPQKYIDSKRLRMAAKEILRGENDHSDILKKYQFPSMTAFSRKFTNHFGVSYEEYREPEVILPDWIDVDYGTRRRIKVSAVSIPALRVALHPLSKESDKMDVGDFPGLVTYWFTHDWEHNHKGYCRKSKDNTDKVFIYDVGLFKNEKPGGNTCPIGIVLEENGNKSSSGIVPEGYEERILEGGSYVQFEIEEPYEQKDLLEIYQQMESSIFLKWYYDSQLIISTTKEKLIRYKNGKMQFLIPLEI